MSYSIKELITSLARSMSVNGKNDFDEVEKELIEMAERRSGKTIDELEADCNKEKMYDPEIEDQLNALESEF